MVAGTKNSYIAGVYSLADAVADIVPVVFDSPHSGTAFPPDFWSPVPRDVLMRAADLYVDELFAGAPERGAALLNAHFPRIYLDANRPPSEADAMFSTDTEGDGSGANHKAAKGIGLIWTSAPDQSPIYDHPLSEAQVRHRIEQYWAPYHAVLELLLAGRRDAFGAVWHVNCHSMPGTGTKVMGDFGQPRPDFIIGDRDGTTCSGEFTRLIVKFLRDRGFDTRVNERFKGVEIVRRYGNPAVGCHSIQIEINRSLYMNERSFERLAGFRDFRDDVIGPLRDAVCAYAAAQSPQISPSTRAKLPPR